MRFVKAFCTVAFATLLVNCGGGGQATSPTPSQNATAAQRVTVTINIPGRTKSGQRNVKYVGAGTQSAVFTVTPAGATASPSVTSNCTSVCQATLAVFPGSNTFAVSLYDGTNGGGSLLSSGSTTQTIVAGINNVNLTFNGVPALVTMAFSPTSLISGTPATSNLTVTVLDADNNAIVAPGNYSDPITLSSGQSYVTVSPTTLTAPGQTVTVTYDGTPVGTDATVAISSQIGSATPLQTSGITIATGAPPGFSLSQSAITVAAGGGTGTVTVTDTGFNGTITADATTCSGPGNATINPTSGTGPSQTFTITGQTATFPMPGCAIIFSDGTNSSTLMVNVQ